MAFNTCCLFVSTTKLLFINEASRAATRALGQFKCHNEVVNDHTCSLPLDTFYF